MRTHLFNNCLSSMRWSLIALLAVGASMAQAQVQGITDTEIVIGAVLDLSGPLAIAGGPQRDGMIFATEEINNAGGIHGRKIRLILEDSGYDTKKGILITQKLLSQDKVFALVNTFGSAIVQATQPVAIEHGIPFLFPSAASNITYLPFHPLKFGLFATSNDHMRVVVDYAYGKLGKRRFGILYQDDETGQSALRAAEDQLKAHGLTLVERTSYKRGDTNFSAQVSRLKAANADIVVVGHSIREGASVAIETKAHGWPVDMMVPWGTVNAVITLGGPAVEGLYGATQFAVQPQTTAFKAFNERFKARFGHGGIQDYGTYGYTAMMLFAEGAKNAGRNLTPQSLSQGLEKIKNFKTTIEGPLITYGPGNHASPADAYIMQVRAGRWVQIAGPIAYENMAK